MRRHRVAIHLLAAGVLVVALASCQLLPQEDIEQAVHINEIQTMGSHNSYHVIATVPERQLRRSVIGAGPETELTYEHRPLDVQLQSEKIRQIELDVFDDPDGGLYADPLIRQVTGGGAYDPVMEQPGIKVLHAQDVDYHSSCLTLQACLTTVQQWSDAHPTHMPVAILIELKDDIIDVGGFTFVHPLPYGSAAMGPPRRRDPQRVRPRGHDHPRRRAG